MELSILTTQPEKDYALLDSGDEEKLERYGKVIVRRPDPQALWHKQMSGQEWDKAQAVFTRDEDDARWQLAEGLPESWSIDFQGLKFLIKLSAFKHTGLFPEQAANWQWASNLIKTKKNVKILNLFGYTAGATLAAAKAGAEVCHVDSSKPAMIWARNNAEASGLAAAPVRWIVEDAGTFVRRELNRGSKYDGIILDPPAFGHGPKGELWKIEEDLVRLLENCVSLLSTKPLFFLINGYAAGYSPLAYAHNLEVLTRKYGGQITAGELTIAEEKSGRLLPCGIFARWQN
ncbi:MAG: class I SAM-dependent methyltransferase [Candidatus Komeilibacteria bacterium]|nr:class I SAM-dependent methyltransferase [Candidatus Komeilibacteria bacterium]